MNARRLVLIPLALAAVLASAMPAGAQTSTSGLNIRQVDTSAFPTVAVTVSADNSVAPSSVRVTENGKPVTVVSNTPLAQSGGSFDVVLSIDTSDSVKGAPLQAAVSLLHGDYRPSEIGNAVRIGGEELAGFVEIRLVFLTRNK